MLFAVCAPGLERLLLAEVAGLGVSGHVLSGGVQIPDDSAIERANLWLRTASRVLLRMGELRATTFPELVRKASALRWEKHLAKGMRVAFHVTCRKSRLYHSGAVRERLHAGLQERLGYDVPLGESEEAGQLFVARFERDVCTVSADTSGALLHQRGWRGAHAKAPLRETLAAALLLAAGYSGAEPVCDPLCGSGTIAIEAALIAMRRAPGLSRAFAFQRWPGFDERRWQELRAEAQRGERLPAARIEASDQDAGAIAAARDNAARAGVPVDIEQRRLAELPADAGAGLVACNPPYGVRVAGGNIARDLIGALRRRPSWKLAAVTPDAGAFSRAGAQVNALLRTQNGGLRVEMVEAIVGGA